MGKPRNAEEQAFWDAAFIALVGGNEAAEVHRGLDSCADLADMMLAIRRKRTDPDAPP